MFNVASLNGVKQEEDKDRVGALYQLLQQEQEQKKQGGGWLKNALGIGLTAFGAVTGNPALISAGVGSLTQGRLGGLSRQDGQSKDNLLGSLLGELK